MKEQNSIFIRIIIFLLGAMVLFMVICMYYGLYVMLFQEEMPTTSFETTQRIEPISYTIDEISGDTTFLYIIPKK